MDVQLLLSEPVGAPAAGELADLGAEHVAVEGVGARRIGDRDDRVVETRPRPLYRIASSSAFTSRLKTSMSTRGFSASAGIRWWSASSYVGSSAW